jgi:metal-sulfur cluster biosynthetic enzyme
MAAIIFYSMSDQPVPTPPVVSEDQVKLALRRVKDPELDLNIMDIGLVYAIAVEGSKVKVDMSLTSPGCPSGPEIMGDAKREIESLPGSRARTSISSGLRSGRQRNGAASEGLPRLLRLGSGTTAPA